MKVVVLNDFDQAPQIADVEIPEPAEGEIRVKVHAASINGFDLSVAASRLQGMMEHRFPVVLGKDFAGVVDSLGGGVTDYAVGDRVFGVVTKNYLGDGSFGEYVTVPTAVGVAKLPDGVEFAEGAGLGLAGTAALDAFDAAAIKDGATVLVVGATGGVGQQALQLAKNAGATVIATASSAEEISLVKDLGATHTVDYAQDLAPQVQANVPAGADVVLHFAGSPDTVVPVVKNGGTLVSTMLRSADDVATEDFQVVSIYANPAPETLKRIAGGHAEQATSVTVQKVYDLDQTTQAFADFSAGTLGKLVISIA